MKSIILSLGIVFSCGAYADYAPEVCQQTVESNYQSEQGKLVRSSVLEAVKAPRYIYLVKWSSGSSEGTDRVWVDSEQCEIEQIMPL